jgi:polysaccharide biosynthesis transport protein
VYRNLPPPAPIQVSATATALPLQEPVLNIWNYWLIIRKHRELVQRCAIVSAILLALIVIAMKPIYTATTTLMIERTTPEVLDIKQVMPETQVVDEYDYYKTQYQLLKSPALAADVIRRLNLSDQQLQPGFRESLRGFISGFAGLFHTASSSQRGLWADTQGVPPRLIDAYMRRLEIIPMRGTRLVAVAFSSPDPVLAARVANAHAAAYIQRGIRLSDRPNLEAQKFLQQKLTELKQRLEKSERALNSYRHDKGIISLNDKEDIVVQQLDDLNRNLTAAEVDRIGLEAQVEQIKAHDYDSLPAVASSDLIQKLRQEETRLEGEYAGMARQYKPGYTPLDQLAAQLQQSRTRLQLEVRRVVATVRTSYHAALAKEKELRDQMNEQKELALAQKDAGVQYAILAREVDTNRQLYDSVLQRMKETGVAAQVQPSNVFSIDAASPPIRASSPKKTEDIVLGAILGLLGGIGLAFLLEALDDTFKNPEEVEQYLQLPNLGVIPSFNADPDKPLGLLDDTQRASPASKEIVAYHDRFSVITESYRTLRSVLQLSREDPPKVIMVTSALSSEGKTVTAVNAAVLFADTGAQVLLVDADLRRPACHRLLQMENNSGLSDVLGGKLDIEKAIRPTFVQKLYVLPSGTIPPNPAELMGSDKARETFKFLRGYFDYIIIDTGPTALVSDALPLATLCDGTLIVVNGPSTSRHLVRQVCARLEQVGARVLGVVLNQVNTDSPDYAGSKYYHSYQKEYCQELRAS